MHRVFTLVALLGSLAACERGSGVVWDSARPAPLGDGALVVDSAGRVGRAPLAAAPASWPSAPMCPGSARAAWRDTATVYAAWWAARPDSSAALWAATSTDGGATWRAPVKVDTLDRSSDGCRRAAPSVAASGDYVHVVYGLRAPEGAGIFFSHSMDRGAMYHAPVIIVYGDHPGAAAVAARGDTVAVAYVDPNVTPPAIGLAISRSMGHAFELRAPASSGASEAVAVAAPAVALGPGVVAVSWREGGAPADSARDVRLVRVGRLR